MVIYYSGGSSFGRAWPEYILSGRANIMLTYEREREEKTGPNRSTRLRDIVTVNENDTVHERGR